jgi:hypothetical protein
LNLLQSLIEADRKKRCEEIGSWIAKLSVRVLAGLLPNSKGIFKKKKTARR